MSSKNEPVLERVYSAASNEQRAEAYDDWARDYEADLFRFGYRLPQVAAAVFCRHIAPEAGPILDAGCGTGLQAEPLCLAGYGPFVGIDLSEGMLKVAAGKGLYRELHAMALGGALDFADGAFAATLSIGTITPGHAPPESFDELIRVTAPGGRIVFSLRVDGEQDPAYHAAVAGHERAGAWRRLFATSGFKSMPLGEPQVEHAVYVFETAQ